MMLVMRRPELKQMSFEEIETLRQDIGVKKYVGETCDLGKVWRGR